MEDFDFISSNLPEDPEEDEEDTSGQGSWEADILNANTVAYVSYSLEENQEPEVRPGTPVTTTSDLHKAN